MKLFTSCEHAWAVRYRSRVHGTCVLVWIEECVHCGKQVVREHASATGFADARGASSA
ncbi:MAG TPA: hypothetical protein VNJ53_01635 [Gaiellaceae bacterium]|nr:hypothetical protein [Gaiellaceae bacterium]